MTSPRSLPPLRPQQILAPIQRTEGRDSLIRLSPLAALIYSFLFIPPEVSFTFLSVNLPSYRIILIGFALYLLIGLLRARSRPNPVDILIFLALGWMLLSFMLAYGPVTGTIRGFGLLIDAGGAYLLARVSVASLNDLRRLLVIIAPGLAFAGALLTVESLSGELIYRPAFASLFGDVTAYSSGEADGTVGLRYETRLGLLRAYGPFSHPILGGVTLAAFLPLFWLSHLRSWPFYLGVVSCAAGFFSLSSAALLALLMAGGIIVIDRLKRSFLSVGWPIIIGMIGIAGTAVHVASQSGIIAVLGRFTLNPGTAGYRTLIWEYGLKSVANHPWVGIGYEAFERLPWMGESVDAHFLMLAIRHGVIVPILIALAMLWTLITLGAASRSCSGHDRDLLVGVNIALAVLFVVGQTVAYFGSTNLLFMALIGISASLCAWFRDGAIAYRPARRAGEPPSLTRPISLASHDAFRQS